MTHDDASVETVSAPTLPMPTDLGDLIVTSPSYQSATESQPRGPGLTPYVISLVVGLPTTLMMAYFAYGQLFPALTLALAALSALGCVLAVAGMRSSPRRFRGAALVLTLIPGLATIAGFGVLIAILVIFVTTATGGQ